MSDDPEITLTLPRSQVNLILAALGELPLKVGYAAFEAVRSQTVAGLALAPPAKEDSVS